MSQEEALSLKMDHLDEYDYTKPFPKDMFLRLPVGAPDQAYVILGQKGTGMVEYYDATWPHHIFQINKGGG